MALTVTATVTRGDLGLSDLNINDHNNYSIAPNTMGGATSWDRNQVSSPWVDGEITISRRRSNVMEPVLVNVYGVSQPDMLANLQTLVDAFCQNSFTMIIKLGSATYQYSCEAADYSIEWGYKMHSTQCMANFQVPRHPIPTSGGV